MKQPAHYHMSGLLQINTAEARINQLYPFFGESQEGELNMTVREARNTLFGPEGKKVIEVHYEGEAYDITLPSPAQESFDKFIVDCVSAPQPFHYCISLKQRYLVEGETV